MINYCHSIPSCIERICQTAPMKRLVDVGINCGCEYTAFGRFKNLPKYSRYEHSIGSSLIVWNFTHDKTQAISALLHDIATPVFAHTIDFLNGDYVKQESTESRTSDIILDSGELVDVLIEEGINIGDVLDYHKYPIADNESPQPSADRLEYTVGNAERYNIASSPRLQKLYDDLVVTKNEDNNDELAFTDITLAADFVDITLACSSIYIADEDRYSMQILSEVIAEAMSSGIITIDDLYTTETQVIDKLRSDANTSMLWSNFRRLHQMITDDERTPEEYRRVIPAKKRYIDPLVVGQGRVSKINPSSKAAISDFLNRPLYKWLYAI